MATSSSESESLRQMQSIVGFLGVEVEREGLEAVVVGFVLVKTGEMDGVPSSVVNLTLGVAV
jgi:hypothetical protein